MVDNAISIMTILIKKGAEHAVAAAWAWAALARR
jgi:hypothetical protein